MNHHTHNTCVCTCTIQCATLLACTECVENNSFLYCFLYMYNVAGVCILYTEHVETLVSHEAFFFFDFILCLIVESTLFFTMSVHVNVVLLS